jgi:hypothetical protein
VEDSPNNWLLANSSIALGENNQLIARDTIFLDRFANDYLADSV